MNLLTVRVFSFLFISTINLNIYSQKYFNLDFETKIPQTDLPKKWFVRGAGYEIKLDSIIKNSGKYSLKMVNAEQLNKSVGISTSSFPVELMRGKTVAFKGKIKTENVINGYAGLWLRVDGNNKLLSFDNMYDRGIKGTSDWKEVSILMDIPLEAKGIFFGGIFSGEGSAWFDTFEISIDNILYQEKIPEIKLPNNDELKWLSKNIIPIKTVDPNSIKDNDLYFLNDIVKNSKIVALGEASHGSKEIFKMKHRIIKYLKEHMGFDIFSIEANMPESYMLNNYIVQNQGKPKELIKGMYFWTWNTQETLDMVNWMNEYNLDHEEKILFTGFDMQYYQGAINELKKIVDKEELKILESLESELATSKANKLVPKDTFDEKLNHIKNWISENITNPKKKNWGIQNIKIINQAIDKSSGRKRDLYMADNMSWIIENNPQSKFIIWGHNGHIKKSRNVMGGYLSEKYGKDYLSIGFAFHKGVYTAKGKEGLKAYPAKESYPGTYEYFFKSIKEPIFLLDMRNIHPERENKWLFNTLDFRVVGASKLDNEFFETSITDDFDIIIFINESNSSKLLKD
ncbi:erythromycin esterase family protein [Leptobacterium sp. I13]|uniref:erythromycin esterase family protein n=1 Tax=Leptobacterium meishanense TaxID=3128904 RepID=UPI0030EEED81